MEVSLSLIFFNVSRMAKEKKVRIWKDYKPSASSVNHKDKNYSGKVMDVCTVRQICSLSYSVCVVKFSRNMCLKSSLLFSI